MHIIAVANQKGGVGKTTTAVNVAASLAKQKKRTLLVDLDPQANATSGLGLMKDIQPSIAELLHDPAVFAKAVIKTPFHGLDIIPARPDLANSEVAMVSVESRETRLKSALVGLPYDYIIIDCPPALGLLTINALTAATHVLIPVQSEYYAMEGLGQLLQTVQQIRIQLNPQLKLAGVVLTMFDARNILSKQVKDELNKHLPGQVFSTIVPRNVRLAEAPSFGKPVSHYDKWSKGTKAYKKLTNEIIKKTRI